MNIHLWNHSHLPPPYLKITSYLEYQLYMKLMWHILSDTFKKNSTANIQTIAQRIILHWGLILNSKLLMLDGNLLKLLYTYSELLCCFFWSLHPSSSLPPSLEQMLLDKKKKTYMVSDYPIFAIEEEVVGRRKEEVAACIQSCGTIRDGRWVSFSAISQSVV